MKRALIVSTVGRQFFLFEAANIRVLKELGYEIHGAANLANEDRRRLDAVDITTHHIRFERGPLSPKNLIALIELVRLMTRLKPDLVHCHSPVGGVVGRLAARLAGVPKVVYTAHGFHFFRGSGARSWATFYPVEWLASFATDLLITINDEDYRAAQRLHAGATVLIPGVGVDRGRFGPSRQARDDVRRELGISDDTFVAASVGELSRRKNHAATLRGLALAEAPAHLLLCGVGAEEAGLRELAAELHVDQRVHFLGYRSDIERVCAAADVYVASSRQEGLPISVIEAMFAGLPVLCSDIRGHRDLVAEGGNGWLFDPAEPRGLARLLDELAQDSDYRAALGARSLELAGSFDLDAVAEEMRQVYRKVTS
ncbi:glycosyltransferase involved in cell wall biosynthesis [Propionicimonas paludicola]|uniref:Glycosyltransferase involved in cell wall biosynthesis n=1 Tax=Propionicimonas paludicola TaxID=185243 RepID=A0A2A9CSX6_9ACTN|nr:glycosyltransferase family 4 protein [Propionicimonas paludicola]PFG17468.1 glycosyltransferase involved in cell wall biosynthesis [Propionicimonas paludicola]